MQIFAKRLRERILARHQSLAEFCRRIGIRQERLNHWLSSRGSQPDYEMLIKICRELDTHPNYLLGESEKSEPEARNEASRLRALELKINELQRHLARQKSS